MEEQFSYEINHRLLGNAVVSHRVVPQGDFSVETGSH
jgi:hypothetical protein